MECKDCERSPACSYMIDATSCEDALIGRTVYIKGTDCPKDWHDKKVEDMTEGQLREAVRELREKLLDSIKPSWNDNATCSDDKVTEYKKVNILGTEYKIIRKSKKDEPKLQDAFGYTEPYSHKIVVDTFEDEIEDFQTVENFDEFVKKVIRHETVHAFFGESGLKSHSGFAENEELVDWIAIQAPKMVEVWQELGVL